MLFRQSPTLKVQVNICTPGSTNKLVETFLL